MVDDEHPASANGILSKSKTTSISWPKSCGQLVPIARAMSVSHSNPLRLPRLTYPSSHGMCSELTKYVKPRMPSRTLMDTTIGFHPTILVPTCVSTTARQAHILCVMGKGYTRAHYRLELSRTRPSRSITAKGSGS